MEDSNKKDGYITKILNLLYPHLKEYIESCGVKIQENGFFSCIHPKHPDHHPSCHIIDESPGKDNVFYCFSGKHVGNIFHAAFYLENKPITGIGFFEETLPYLCKKYGIDFEPIELSDDVKREYQKRRAYSDAVNIVHYGAFSGVELKTSHPAIQHLLNRGINEQAIKLFKIGCIDSFQEYINDMKSTGWADRDWLNGADLANKNLFNKDGIIIPIFDDRGRPVGFVTRKTTMAEGEKGNEKFVNSLNSDIYHKSEILFNFNNYKKENGPLYIVEGYLDAVYLTQVGIKNVVAIGATILTEQHIKLLMDYGCKNIIICLDGDTGGKNGVNIAVERLSPYKYFNVRIMELPEGYDPDKYIRDNGVNAFLELAKPDIALSPFAWTLKNTTFEDDPIQTAEKAIPAIAAEESNLIRLKMIKELSKLTGIPEGDIRKDVDSLVNKESSAFIEELNNINNFVQVQLNKRKTKDTKVILEDALIRITNLERVHNNPIDNKSEFSTRINVMKEKVEGGDYKYGLRTNKYDKCEKIFDGLPYTACLSLVGGRPSSGKTSFLTALGIDIIECNEDAALMYMSIDDTTELMMLKMIASKSGLTTSQIKRYCELPDEQKEKINSAWGWLEKLSERFIIADASSGNTIEALESHVSWFMKNFPNSKRLMMLDNFHKLSVGNSSRSKVEAVSNLSERIKTITQINNLHLMATVELRKLESSSNRPTIGDLKDSVQMEYDADIVMLAHNDYQVNEKSNIVYIGTADGEEVIMPYIEMRVWKNKVTGKLDNLAYKFNSRNLQLTEVAYQEVKTKIEMKNNNSRMAF